MQDYVELTQKYLQPKVYTQVVVLPREGSMTQTTSLIFLGSEKIKK